MSGGGSSSLDDMLRQARTVRRLATRCPRAITVDGMTYDAVGWLDYFCEESKNWVYLDNGAYQYIMRKRSDMPFDSSTEDYYLSWEDLENYLQYFIAMLSNWD